VLWYNSAFVVLGLAFPYQAKRLAWETPWKWPILCRVGHKTTTQPSHILFVFVVEFVAVDYVTRDNHHAVLLSAGM